MEKEEIYKMVKDATFEAGRTIAMKLEEELQELEDEIKISLRTIEDKLNIHNLLHLADEIADVTIVADQYSEKDFWQLVCDCRVRKLDLLEERAIRGDLFRELKTDRLR